MRFTMRTYRDMVWRAAKDSRYLKENKLRIKEALIKQDVEARAKLWPLVKKAREEGKKVSWKGPHAFVAGKKLELCPWDGQRIVLYSQITFMEHLIFEFNSRIVREQFFTFWWLPPCSLHELHLINLSFTNNLQRAFHLNVSFMLGQFLILFYNNFLFTVYFHGASEVELGSWLCIDKQSLNADRFMGQRESFILCCGSFITNKLCPLIQLHFCLSYRVCVSFNYLFVNAVLQR